MGTRKKFRNYSLPIKLRTMLSNDTSNLKHFIIKQLLDDSSELTRVMTDYLLPYVWILEGSFKSESKELRKLVYQPLHDSYKDFYNKMSFLTSQPATANLITNTKVKYLQSSLFDNPVVSMSLKEDITTAIHIMQKDKEIKNYLNNVSQATPEDTQYYIKLITNLPSWLSILEHRLQTVLDSFNNKER